MTTRLERTVLDQVRMEHVAIQRLLDAIASSGSASALQPYLWDLYLCFNDHLDMEERAIAPALEPAAATRMLLEHNEQRRIVRELVEDLSGEAAPEADLVQRARSLVLMLRGDIAHEEVALQVLARVNEPELTSNR